MYEYTTSASDVSGAASMGAGSWIFTMIISVVAILAMWKIFTKAGEAGWKSIIPVYNAIVLFKIAGLSPWLILLELVPVANIIVLIMLYVKLAKAFGKSNGFAVGLIFLNLIFMLILAFDGSQYVGPQA